MTRSTCLWTFEMVNSLESPETRPKKITIPTTWSTGEVAVREKMFRINLHESYNPVLWQTRGQGPQTGRLALPSTKRRPSTTCQLVHALGAWLHVRDGSAASDRAHPRARLPSLRSSPVTFVYEQRRKHKYVRTLPKPFSISASVLFLVFRGSER